MDRFRICRPFFPYLALAFVFSISACTSSQGAGAGSKEPSPEEMLRMWKEVSSPGAEHERLQPLVGSWSTEVKLYAEPGRPPSVSKGAAKHAWILGGRFLEQDYEGEIAELPFRGKALIGYDRVIGRYLSVWVDTFSTGIFASAGDFDPATNTLTLLGAVQDPVTRKVKRSRSSTKILNQNEHLYEIFELDGTGNERKSLEVHYKRKK